MMIVLILIINFTIEMTLEILLDNIMIDSSKIINVPYQILELTLKNNKIENIFKI